MFSVSPAVPSGGTSVRALSGFYFRVCPLLFAEGPLQSADGSRRHEIGEEEEPETGKVRWDLPS